jgi:hypothetical protein
MFDFNHLSTWETHRSTRRVRCWTRLDVHSESWMCCRDLDRSQESCKMDNWCLRSATGMSSLASKNRASVSSASTTRSMSKPYRLQSDAACFEFYTNRTLSGSSSGTNPVLGAMGKIARREFARCAAIVSKMDFQERSTTRTWEHT